MPSIKICGRDVLFDEEDLALLQGRNWTLRSSGNHLYVQRTIYADGKYIGYESLHRLISKCQPGQVVDHINGDSLDNRRSNLRVCSAAQNRLNCRRHKNNQAGLKGVYLDKECATTRWRASIRANGKKHNLGSFSTKNEAHAAYVRAAKRLHGEFARTG